MHFTSLIGGVAVLIGLGFVFGNYEIYILRPQAFYSEFKRAKELEAKGERLSPDQLFQLGVGRDVIRGGWWVASGLLFLAMGALL